jgi:hypothetical protein
MTLSAASPRVPLTVGTTKGLLLHDHRAPERPQDFRSKLFSKEPLLPYASLRPPQCIFHLPSTAGGDDVSDTIYVAGRFSSIIRFDRRHWPTVMGIVHSGASSICGLASLPYRYSSVDAALCRRGQLTRDQVKEMKSESMGGYTVVAGGEYNTKGSLELYGISHTAHTDHTAGRGGLVEDTSMLQNRQTVSSSKVLSIATHGTRILFSDGNGYLKWFERGGESRAQEPGCIAYGQSQTLLANRLRDHRGASP